MRTHIVRLVLLGGVLLLSTWESRAESWRGVIPLKSTRADVERLFGKPIPGVVDFLATYRLDDCEVRFHYQVKEQCREVDRCECAVPDDTVIEIAVESKSKAKFSSLKIDRTAFDRFPLVENTGIIIYRNSKAGLIYAVSDEDDVVIYVQYAPSAEDCRAVLKKQ
jgi:hypothetical protein